MINIERVKRLVTGEYTWVAEDGSTEVDHYGWKDRWSIDGIHSWQWRWVHKYGQLPCGCTRNPITRRMVLYRWPCSENHAGLNWAAEELNA